MNMKGYAKAVADAAWPDAGPQAEAGTFNPYIPKVSSLPVENEKRTKVAASIIGDELLPRLTTDANVDSILALNAELQCRNAASSVSDDNAKALQDACAAVNALAALFQTSVATVEQIETRHSAVGNLC